MIIIDYAKKHHFKLIRACAGALRSGKIIAYPTDTSYGLACDIYNKKAIKKFYNIKQRTFNKPVHVVVPSVVHAKKIAQWNSLASKLAKRFWPGPLSIVLPLRSRSPVLKKFSAGTGTIGLRMPDNKIALDLVKYLGQPIPATSANPAGKSGGYDCYEIDDILNQFKKKKYKPDIILNAGKLPKRKPSTLVKISFGKWEILRRGPITEKQIIQAII